MAKRARQRVSYVLAIAQTSGGGHRLGVNGLAFDTRSDVLYSGGRDGIVCAWDVGHALQQRARADLSDPTGSIETKTRHRAQIQAHMHWINDLTLAQQNTAVVTASSDQAVKVWRPDSQEPGTQAQTIGEHTDYAKCVSAPPAKMNATWVASGGLDRRIYLWDLKGGGKTLEINVEGEEMKEKGSVYALAVGSNILASGGPEKVVQLHDPRTGSKISKLVGHVGNIRAILIDEAGDTILSASHDKTVKMWSVKGGRCMYTFTMHDDMVWSLFSDDAQLAVFYSSDRSGLVAKTDLRGSLEDMDHGLSLAVAHEHTGVVKVVAADGNIWTATNRSSIHRWADVDTGRGPQPLGGSRRQHAASQPDQRAFEPESMLQMSNTAVLPSRSALLPSDTPGELFARRASSALAGETYLDVKVKPVNHSPEETIEGQCGLLKHKLLNDRRRVLTLDTAGEVLLWDLIACKPVQSFGMAHIEDVEKEVNTREAVAPWCSIDLSSGILTITLDAFNCFDAEIYADELELDGEKVEFREDQRISLGKWVLRYLFTHLIDEEMERDEVFRQNLHSESERRLLKISQAPTPIDTSSANVPAPSGPDSGKIPRSHGFSLSAMASGLGIGLATPGLAGSPLPGVPEVAVLSPAEGRESGDRDDYFAVDRSYRGPHTPTSEMMDNAGSQNADASGEKTKERDKEKSGGDVGKSPSTPFGRKFRLSFSSKKLGRSSSQATQDKPTVADDKMDGSEISSLHEGEIDNNFLGVVQKLRNEYRKQLAEAPAKALETRITPSPPSETPHLSLPPTTIIMLQEETSGGSANIYQGTVEGIGRDADVIEQKGPMWLGEVLLRNYMPFKEPIKVSFVLHPMDDLPSVSQSEGANRLNANRMLRVRKILAYVAERVEEGSEEESAGRMPAEEYLELYCNNQLLEPAMSLATIRAHVWKGGNDIVLHYRANGRKEIKPTRMSLPAQPSEQSGGGGVGGVTGPAFDGDGRGSSPDRY